MRVKLLTDGGYGLTFDEMSQIYNAKKKNLGYIINIGGIDMYFYSDEVEVIQDHVYFLDTSDDSRTTMIIVVGVIATILFMAAIFYVIF